MISFSLFLFGTGLVITNLVLERNKTPGIVTGILLLLIFMLAPR